MKRSGLGFLFLFVAMTSAAGTALAWEDPPKTLKDNDPALVPTYEPDGTTKKFKGDDKAQRERYQKATTYAYVSDGEDTPKSNPPVFYVMGGGGASGKGVVKDTLIALKRIHTAGVVSIDPDEIKGQLPEYQQVIAKGDGRAAEVVHEESSIIAKQVLAQAFENKYNILMDVTLGNPQKGLQQIAAAKQKGYKVVLIGVTVNPALAVTRAVERAKKTGRWVPRKMLLDAHKGFSEGFEEYAKLADVVYLYDTTDATKGSEPALVGMKEEGKAFVIKDQARWEAFMKKKKININATSEADLYTK